jgi:hypothetical protein
LWERQCGFWVSASNVSMSIETSQVENKDVTVERAVTLPTSTTAAGKKSEHGWLSAARSYLILDPLIWVYTLVLGPLSLISSLVDRGGRVQHWFAWLWSWFIMKTTLSPVRVIGLDKIDTRSRMSML